jgi:hypothetical protein
LRVYLSDGSRVTLAEDSDGDGAAETITPLVREISTLDRSNAGLTLGPDGSLYISLAATCGAFCTQADAAAGSVVAIDPENRALRVVATGLEQPSALAFAPGGAPWMVRARGSSLCGMPDVVVTVQDGVDCAGILCGSGEASLDAPESIALGEGSGLRALVWFASELLPPDLSGGFFVAFAADEAGAAGSVQFVQRDADGRLSVRDFATGFDDPVALAAGSDGMPYVADAGRGVIYWIGPPLESDTSAAVLED